MRDPEIEAKTLTDQEFDDAIYEGKKVKFFHQKAVKNGISWEGKEVNYDGWEHNPFDPRNFKKFAALERKDLEKLADEPK